MSSRYVLPIESYSRTRFGSVSGRIGGKAARTLWLREHGFPVPQAWVIDVRAFKAFARARLERDLRPRALLELRRDRERDDRAARARARILAEALPASLVDELSAYWAQVEPSARYGLAVRSSATAEDDETASMAGLAHSELGVFGGDGLAAAVQQVWASALLPRALSYLAARGVRDVAMAVLIEPVIRADAAGVAFTSPPTGLELGHADSEMIVNAAVGLGLRVVDGASTPDVVRVDRATGRVLDYLCADKPLARVATESGLREVAVEEERRRAPALQPSHLEDLAKHARALEALEPSTRFDLEFAVDSAGVWLLQARPATGRAYPEGGTKDTVWSRVNLSEALPGAATPLTWSVASSFADAGFRKAFDALGCDVPSDSKLVARVHGRFYLNLTAFMRIASQVPGLDPRTLVELGGGGGAEVLERQIEQAPISAYLKLPWLAGRIALDQSRLAGEVDRFEPRMERARRSMIEMDLSILPDDALAARFCASRELLHECGELMLSCASAALASYLALRTLLDRVVPEHSRRLVQRLASGLGDLESARPGFGLAHLAEVVRRDAGALAALAAGDVKRPADLPDGEGRQAFVAFLAAYGDRAIREAELMTPRWSEDPSSVVAMLRASLAGPPLDPDRGAARAQEESDRMLREIEASVSATFRPFVRALATRARHFTRLRERMRTQVTRVLGILRLVALEIDVRLVRAIPMCRPGCAFFLTFDELIDFLTSHELEWAPLVRVREAEYARDMGRPDPPVTFVGAPSTAVLPPRNSKALRGLAASGGVAQGSARVLQQGARDAGLFEPGEVLVVRTADIGLSPLFLVASAVVTEQGGPLSHAAIVAREYGVPAVVNVSGATTAIRTGDLVRVDGGRGTVERLSPDEGAREADA